MVVEVSNKMQRVVWHRHHRLMTKIDDAFLHPYQKSGHGASFSAARPMVVEVSNKMQRVV
jgi:hypothetical protein